MKKAKKLLIEGKSCQRSYLIKTRKKKRKLKQNNFIF